MSVKPELAFDVCWEVYRGAREVLEAKRGMSAMDWKEATKYLWAAGFSSAACRMGSGLRTGRPSRA